MSGQVFDEVMPYLANAKIVAADTTTLKALYVGNPNGVRIDSILVGNSDTIPHVVDLWIVHSSVNYILGSVSIPAGQGLAGTPTIDLIATCLPATQAGLWLDFSQLLSVSVEVTMVGAFILYVTVVGGVV